MKMKKIMVIDDEVGFTRLLKANLEETGSYAVNVENDGARALESVEWFKPDLILLDVVMPDIDGFEVADQIKGMDAFADVPIVYITATLSREQADSIGNKLKDLPVLAKPVEFDQIVTVIEENLPS